MFVATMAVVVTVKRNRDEREATGSTERGGHVTTV
jgi:hypothetical protein